jgi:hypothetical protein
MPSKSTKDPIDQVMNLVERLMGPMSLVKQTRFLEKILTEVEALLGEDDEEEEAPESGDEEEEEAPDSEEPPG